MSQPHDGHRQRLRERYLLNGASAFADHELLELLLTYAIPRRDTNETAHLLLKRFGSLESVFSANLTELCTVDGIGDGAAIFLRLQHDLQKRMALRKFAGRDGRIYLNSPAASAAYAHELLSSDKTEQAILLCLNTQRICFFQHIKSRHFMLSFR